MFRRNKNDEPSSFKKAHAIELHDAKTIFLADLGELISFPTPLEEIREQYSEMSPTTNAFLDETVELRKAISTKFNQGEHS